MTVDWLPARISDKGKNQEPKQGQFFRVTKLGQSNGHAFMALRRLIAIGAEKPVPPRQIEPVITVGFADDYGVMHPVHIGCDDDISNNPINY